MGNRAVIVNKDKKLALGQQCVYLHWNGGRASVEGFLAAARELNIVGDSNETMSKLADLIAKCYFQVEVGVTVYLMYYSNTDKDNGDNGVYLIDNDMQIVGRKFLPTPYNHVYTEEVNELKTNDIKNTILMNYNLLQTITKAKVQNG